MLGFITFFLVAFSILAAGHYYLWRRLVRDPQLVGGFRRWGTRAILLAALATTQALELPLEAAGEFSTMPVPVALGEHEVLVTVDDAAGGVAALEQVSGRRLRDGDEP